MYSLRCCETYTPFYSLEIINLVDVRYVFVNNAHPNKSKPSVNVHMVFIEDNVMVGCSLLSNTLR